MAAIDDYYDALERLKKNRPVRVEKGVKISNNTVAQEAGRSNGSIKNTREEHKELILSIQLAADTQKAPSISHRKKVERAKQDAEDYRRKYEEALGREVMLLKYIDDQEKIILGLKNGNIMPIKI